MGVTASVSTPSNSSGGSFELQCGMRLGRYELLHRIASGGMAQVWAARQTGDFGFVRTCAVKVIRPELASSRSFRSMFLDEARLAARIRHPHVVEVFDLGESGATIFQAMELVEGDSLTGLLRRADEGTVSLDAGMVARIISDMASGLHAAHELCDEAGNPLHLVHRDISPQNILVSLDGIAKIADFGVAKALGRLSDETEAGQLKGKFSYLSPEQAQRMPIDRRSDVFACGIVLWEALTRSRLFRGSDVVDTLERVRACVVVDPRELATQTPAAIADVTLKALARAPENRYQTAAELSDALERAAISSGVATSARQLAIAVRTGIGDRIDRQRAAIAHAATEVTRATAPTSSPVAIPTRSRRMTLIGASAIVIATAGTTAFFMHRTGASAQNGAGASTPSVASTALTNVTSAVPESSAPTIVATTTSSAVKATPARHHVTPAATTSSRPTLPFGNPY